MHEQSPQLRLLCCAILVFSYSRQLFLFAYCYCQQQFRSLGTEHRRLGTWVDWGSPAVVGEVNKQELTRAIKIYQERFYFKCTLELGGLLPGTTLINFGANRFCTNRLEFCTVLTRITSALIA